MMLFERISPSFLFLVVPFSQLIASAAAITADISTTPTASAATSFVTATNGDVSFTISQSLANFMTSNANQQVCTDTTAKKRSFDSGLSCATSNAANSMAIANGRQDILGDLLLMPTTAPVLAGDLRLAVANLVAFAWRNEFFPTATKAVMNTIAVALLIISLLLYNNPNQPIFTNTIPHAEIATDPDISTQMPGIEASLQLLSQNPSSVARTLSPTRSSRVSLTLTRSCSSVSVDKTVVPMCCNATSCAGDGEVCGKGQWEDCPCWGLDSDDENIEPFDFGFFTVQQDYYASIAACPNCSPVSAPVMPTGATSTWCACEDEMLYSTQDGSTEYACSYPATKDLPLHVLTVSPYSVTGTEDCTVSTGTITATQTYSPMTMTSGGFTFTSTPSPSFSTFTAVNCVCEGGIEVGATPATINGISTHACQTAAPGTTTSAQAPMITSAPPDWKVAFLPNGKWCTDTPPSLSNFVLSGTGTQSCTVMPTPSGSWWARVGYASMTNWDYCITLFDTSDCNTQLLGEMATFCGPGQGCARWLSPFHAYEVNVNKYGSTGESWVHQGMNPTLAPTPT